MDDAALVRVGQAVRNLHEETQLRIERQRPMIIDQLREIDALDVLHDDV